jgi:hypothetical protein
MLMARRKAAFTSRRSFSVAKLFFGWLCHAEVRYKNDRKSTEIVDLARRVAVAWNQLADEFEQRSATACC